MSSRRSLQLQPYIAIFDEHAAGSPHPGLRPNAPDPVCERRDEAEALDAVLFADEVDWDGATDLLVMVTPNTRSARKMPSA